MIKKVLKRFAPQCFARYQILRADTIRLNVGAGGKSFPGWISLEKAALDITKIEDWNKVLRRNKVTNILAEHVFEHLSFGQAIAAFKNIAKYLDTDGVFRFAVPDGNHPSGYVRQLTGVNGAEPGAEDHKYFYRVEDVAKIEKASGLKADLIEYFDADGIFHSKIYDTANGHISRCADNYRGRFTSSNSELEKFYATLPVHLHEFFRSKNLTYTSLFIDWRVMD